MSDRYDFLNEALNHRKEQHQFRSLQAVNPSAEGVTAMVENKKFINFSSNDYLGLATHPEVKDKAADFAQKFGAGSTASRLICGTFDIHEQLETAIAEVLDRESALLFNTGFQANSSILGTVTDRHSLILADKLSHNSLLQGSLSSRAEFQRFQHNDLNHLERLLHRARSKDYNRIWIVTETIFSMDGDRSPLDEISTLAEKYDALLFVDDAHAVGVWGPNGLGLGKEYKRIDILLGTCGKAFGSFGAYVACSQKMKDYLVNFCPGFIYTTALPPAVIGATQAALELIPRLEEQRKAFHQRIEDFRNTIRKIGFDTGPSTSQIVPLIVGSEEKTLELSKWLKQNGILTTAIHPPTVPQNSSRLRITLSAAHTEVHIEKLISALKNWKKQHG